MTLDKTPIEKLIELDNLLHDDNLNINDWGNEFENENDLRENLIISITEDILDKGYDGENDFNAMFWFMKGIKSIPIPPVELKQPKRYVETDDYINRHRKREDDKLFKGLDKYKVKDSVDEYIKDRSQINFKNERDRERLIFKTRNENYKKMLIDLVENKPLLRPLAPMEMKELKPYHEKLFEAENEEVVNFFTKCGSDFESKDNKYLTINVPNDYETAECLLLNHRSKFNAVELKNGNNKSINEDEQRREPIVNYYLNHFGSLDEIFKFIEEIFKHEPKPFKFQCFLGGIFETPIRQNDEVLRYEYENRQINAYIAQYGAGLPILIQTSADLDKVKFYIESFLHTYETSMSSVKLTFVTSILVTIHKLVKITGKLDLPKDIVDSKEVIVDNVDDNLCWYRTLVCYLQPKLRDAKKYNINNRTNAARRLLCEEKGHPYKTNITNEALKFLNNYKGTTMEEIKESAKLHNINVNIYEYIKPYVYDLSDQLHNNDDTNAVPLNVLLYTDSIGVIMHIMYIKNVQKLTGLYVCSKCHSKVFKGKMGYKRCLEHEKKCNGKFCKEYKPEKVSMPYVPHILDSPVYEYCLAHGLKFEPLRFFITFDFETVDEIVNERVTNSTTINAHLLPISVSCKFNSKTLNITENFNVKDNGEEFIGSWIECMFDKAKVIVDDQIEFYKNMLKIEDEDKLKSLVRNLNTVTVIGYNSARFDTNLMKPYFNTKGKWYVENRGLLGTSSSIKQLILAHKNGVRLRFIDAKGYISGGTLAQFGEDYGGVNNSNKGKFPYEAINSKNYLKCLNETKEFEHEAFYSSLTQSNLLTDEEYEEFKEDAKRFKSRWDYLINYNNNDVEMMIKPINNLISDWSKYGVDMLSNISLSKLSSNVKYGKAYKDFDPNANYMVINEVNTFKPTLSWWTYKCDGYYWQDEQFNKKNPKRKQRDLDKCVSEDDFNEFMKMYNDEHTGKCHLCGEHFTYSNKPTLDRIDNDKGHELSNCKLACASCNCLRKQEDDKVNRLRIQLKKYCLLNGLPMTISDEREYYDLREGITGGLSLVMHRLNLRGITHIKKFRYDPEIGKVISYNTPYLISHIIGVDFHSLYPSVFSSKYHEFNPYHGHIMYMPGYEINRYECYGDEGKRNEKVYKACYNIIHSKHRFDPNPKFIFRAKVILELPTEKINDFINFPPVFRNFDIKNNEETIGSYMYNYGKKNEISAIDKTTKKLTMTIDTMGQSFSFGCYYLWFLIDHGLKVVDIINLTTYTATKAFEPFVEEFMGKRQDILAGKVQGNEKFYKIAMNGSYGYDGLNSEKYDKMKICDRSKTFQAIASDRYKGGVKLNNEAWLIEYLPKTYSCKTCIQESFFTLDNAKFWYLTFIYDFLFKCLDLDKIHVTSGDTDSIYFAVAGSLNESNEQGFKHIIKDKEFYYKHIYKFMPNPSINTINDEKKILGCCVEKYGDNQVALCPKCYTIWNNDKINNDGSVVPGVTKSLKLKGIRKKTNSIESSDYKDILDNNGVIKGVNVNLQMKQIINEDGTKSSIMTKITTYKNALTGFHNKMVVLLNQSCAPFIKGISAKDYIII